MNQESQNETAPEEQVEEQAIEVARVELDPNAWQKFMAANTVAASSGQGPRALRRRMVFTTIYPEMCRPGTFDGPIEIGMMELDSATERAVQLGIAVSSPRAADGDLPEQRDASMVGTAFSMALAKAAIQTVNGHQLQPHEVDILWEAIAMAGRQRCGEDFTVHCCGMDARALGKSQASVRVG